MNSVGFLLDGTAERLLRKALAPAGDRRPVCILAACNAAGEEFATLMLVKDPRDLGLTGQSLVTSDDASVVSETGLSAAQCAMEPRYTVSCNFTM